MSSTSPKQNTELVRLFRGGIVISAVLGAVYITLSACTGSPVETIYGNPNSLDRKNVPGEGGAEPIVCGAGAEGGAPAFDGGCPSFATDIYPYMTEKGAWRCSDAKCHGGTSLPVIDTADPTKALASLKAITVLGKPYIVTGDASTEATLLCNLQGACGSKMPKAGATSPSIDPTNADLCKLDAWLKCGAKP